MAIADALLHIFGDRTAPDATLVRDNFASWFGDSKVTAADGTPLVVYHGTGADVSVFEASKAGSNYDDKAGFFFTSRPSNASVYAKKGVTPNVMAVYVALKNPAVYKTKEDAAPHWYARLSDYAAEDAKANGHDGIIVIGKGKEMLVIAFHPEQIKSATGNSGAYSTKDPDISDRRAIQIANALQAKASIDAPARPSISTRSQTTACC